MRALLTTLLLSLLLAACGSNPPKATLDLPAGSHYHLSAVNLILQQKHTVDEYPERKALEKAFADQLRASMSEAEILAEPERANSIGLEVKIDYFRHFAGEDSFAPSSSVAAPTFDYIYFFYKDGERVGKYLKLDQTVGQGFLGNLKTVATGGLGNSLEKEQKDLQKIANAMAAELKSFL